LHAEGPQTENKETNEDAEEEPLRLHRDPSSASSSAAATAATDDDDDDETAPKPIKQKRQQRRHDRIHLPNEDGEHGFCE